MRNRQRTGKKNKWNPRHGDTSEELRKIVKKLGFGDNVFKDHVPGKHRAAQETGKNTSQANDDAPAP